MSGNTAYYIQIIYPRSRMTLTLTRRPRTGQLEYAKGTEYAELFETRKKAMAFIRNKMIAEPYDYFADVGRFPWTPYVIRTTLSNRYYWARA